MSINRLENRQDLEDLFLWLNEPLFKYVYVRCGYNRELAEDITQEIFLKVWEKRDTYNAQKSSLKNWVYIVARNYIIDIYRKRKINTKTFDEEIEGGVTDMGVENDLMMEGVLKKLNMLKDIEREVIILRYVQDLDIKEVAQIVGKSESNTKVIIHRAVKQLKYLINK